MNEERFILKYYNLQAKHKILKIKNIFYEL